MTMLGFAFIAVAAATLFSGAAIYINLVEHPARMQCGTELAVTVFGPSYRRAAVMQAILALTAMIAGIGTWLIDGRLAWFLGALLIGTVVPFTLIIVRPTNNQLLDPALDPKSETARRLLQRWGELHAVRSILALVASMTFIYLALSVSSKPCGLRAIRLRFARDFIPPCGAWTFFSR
jgi:Domain of unknown function (DUF1772)